MRFLRRCLFLTFALLALPVSTLAQAGSLGGRAIDFDSTPMVGITVAIDQEGGAGHWETKTNDRGAYFYQLPLGSYKVALVADDGREINAATGIQIKLGSETSLDFNFKEMAAQDPDYAARRAEMEAAAAAGLAAIAAYDRGRLAMTAKNYEEAVMHFEAGLENDPNSSALYGNLGNALKESGKLDEAEAAYNNAIALKPDEAENYTNLVIVLANSGKMDQTNEVLSRVITMSPATAGQAYYNVGVVLGNRNRIKDAVEFFKKAIEHDPDYFEAYYQLGVSYFGTSQISEAIETLEKYVEMSQDSPNAAVARQLIDAAKAAQP